MADRKISELPLFPHYDTLQNSDIHYVVASGTASENRDATNYRVPFTGLANDVLRLFGGGAKIIDSDGPRIRIGSVEEGDDRDIEFEDNAYMLYDLNVAGDVTFDQDLSLTGDLHVYGQIYGHQNLFIDGLTDIDGNLSVGGDTLLTQELDVLKNATFESGVHIKDNLLTEGNTHVVGNFLVEGSSEFDSDAKFNDSVYIENNLGVGGRSDLTGDLYVYGNAFIDQNTTISGDLTVLGTTTTIDTERLVIEDSNIEIGENGLLTNLDTANFGGVTLKTHNNNSFASVVIEGVTITSRVAGAFGNNISITMLTLPGVSLEDGVTLTDPDNLNGDSKWELTDISILFGVETELSEKNQGDFADLLNCHAGHLVRAVASDRNEPLVETCYRKFLENGQGQDGFDKNISWLKPCDAWTMNTNFHVYGEGFFLEGINAASDVVSGGVKIALSSDTTNYGGLVMQDGYLKIENWDPETNIESEAAFFLSDIKLKSDRKKIDSPTKILDQINGVHFTWNESAHPSLAGKKDVGVIAQEVQAVLPEIVAENTDGNLAVSYHKIIPVLIESIKELSKQNDSLQSRIEKLES